jgi:lysophospholipase L1-like esterase
MGKILVFGDSIVYGKWDKLGGWVARLRKFIDRKYNLKGTNNYQVYNLGIPGEVLPQLENRLAKELKLRINSGENNLIIIAEGVNDGNPENWSRGKTTTKKELGKFVTSLSKLVNSHSKVVYLGLAPVNEERLTMFSGFTSKNTLIYNQHIKRLCLKHKIPFIDVHDPLLAKGYQETIIDGVHPNSKGHEIIVKQVIDYLESQKLIDWCNQVNS